MAKTGTYSLIAETSLSTTSSSVTMTSIPSTFTDLVIVVNAAQPSSTGELTIRFNSDSSANYSYTRAIGGAGGNESLRTSNATVIGSGNLSDVFGIYHISVNDYSNSTTFKTTIHRDSLSNTVNEMVTGLYRSTSPITAVTFAQQNSGNNLFAAGSTFRLYGIQGYN